MFIKGLIDMITIERQHIRVRFEKLDKIIAERVGTTALTYVINRLKNETAGLLPTEREKHYIQAIQELSRVRATVRNCEQQTIDALIAEVRTLAIEDAARIMLALGLSSQLYHRQNLLLWGINVEGESHVLLVAQISNSRLAGAVRYKKFNLRIEHNQSDGLGCASIMLVQKPEEETPYKFTEARRLTYYGHEVNIRVVANDGKISPKHRGFHFPFLSYLRPAKSEDVHSKLTVNPLNIACQSCLPCSRLNVMPTTEELCGKYWLSPEELIAEIVRQFPDVFPRVKHVALITSAFGSEAKCLAYISRLSELLKAHLFRGEVGYLGHEVRSLDGLRQLKEQAGSRPLEFTIEVFNDKKRKALLGKYKGIPMEQVETILANARAAGFQQIAVTLMDGLDSIDDYRGGIQRLTDSRLIDLVAHNITATYASFQEPLLQPEARTFEYHLAIRRILNQAGVLSHMAHEIAKGSVFSFPEVNADFDFVRLDGFESMPDDAILSLVTAENI